MLMNLTCNKSDRVTRHLLRTVYAKIYLFDARWHIWDKQCPYSIPDVYRYAERQMAYEAVNNSLPINKKKIVHFGEYFFSPFKSFKSRNYERLKTKHSLLVLLLTPR